MKRNLITIATLLFLSISGLRAQTTSSTLAPSHLKAAETFLNTMGLNVQFESMTQKMITASSAQMPEQQRASFIKVMEAFMLKYYTWDKLKDSFCKIYAEEFTEDELTQLTAFYNTPLGKKASSKISSLMQKGMVIGQQIIADHRPELEQMMKDAFQNADPPTIKDQQH